MYINIMFIIIISLRRYLLIEIYQSITNKLNVLIGSQSRMRIMDNNSPSSVIVLYN